MQTPAYTPERRFNRQCWFYTTPKGCVRGDACPYAHESAPMMALVEMSDQSLARVPLSQMSGAGVGVGGGGDFRYKERAYPYGSYNPYAAYNYVNANANVNVNRVPPSSYSYCGYSACVRCGKPSRFKFCREHYLEKQRELGTHACQTTGCMNYTMEAFCRSCLAKGIDRLRSRDSIPPMETKKEEQEDEAKRGVESESVVDKETKSDEIPQEDVASHDDAHEGDEDDDDWRKRSVQ